MNAYLTALDIYIVVTYFSSNCWSQQHTVLSTNNKCKCDNWSSAASRLFTKQLKALLASDYYTYTYKLTSILIT